MLNIIHKKGKNYISLKQQLHYYQYQKQGKFEILRNKKFSCFCNLHVHVTQGCCHDADLSSGCNAAFI